MKFRIRVHPFYKVFLGLITMTSTPKQLDKAKRTSASERGPKIKGSFLFGSRSLTSLKKLAAPVLQNLGAHPWVHPVYKYPKWGGF